MDAANNNAVKRIPQIDLLRIICSMSVILIHIIMCWVQDGDIVLFKLVFTGSFLRGSVGCFFIITGFFWFQKERTMRHVYKSFLINIFFPTIIAMLLLQLLDGYLKNEVSLLYCLRHPSVDIKDIVANILAWKSGTVNGFHFWYIFGLVELYVWYPLLCLVCSENKKTAKIRRYLMCIWFIGWCLLPTILEIFPSFGFGAIRFKSPLTRYGIFPLIGYEIWLLYRDQKLKATFKQLFIYLFLFIGGSLFTWFCTLYFDIRVNNTFTQVFYDYEMLGSFITALGLFLLVLIIPMRYNWLNQIMFLIGKNTFYIYLIHWPVFMRFFFTDTCEKMRTILDDLFYPVQTLLVFFMALIIASIAHKSQAILSSLINKPLYVFTKVSDKSISK